MTGRDKNQVAVQVSAALDRDRLAAVGARAAMAGIMLVTIEADDGRTTEFVASRKAKTRRFRSLAEVGQWLDQVGVPAQ